MSAKPPGDKPTTKKTSNSGSSVHRGAVEEVFGVDPQIVFEIEGVLFGLPRSQLMASEMFQDMLGDERLGSPKEGTEENPIRIQKISSVSLYEAKAFHKVMNWRGFDAEPMLSTDQWFQALRLATMWGFKSLREYIIGYLDSHLADPLIRIKVADNCDVKEWLHPAYAKLCARKTPLTKTEGRVLGIERFAALCRIREERLKSDGNSGGYERGEYGDRHAGPPLTGDSFRLPSFLFTNCQEKCCKPRFKLSEREKAFLEMIKKEEDL